MMEVKCHDVVFSLGGRVTPASVPRVSNLRALILEVADDELFEHVRFPRLRRVELHGARIDHLDALLAAMPVLDNVQLRRCMLDAEKSARFALRNFPREIFRGLVLDERMIDEKLARAPAWRAQYQRDLLAHAAQLAPAIPRVVASEEAKQSCAADAADAKTSAAPAAAAAASSAPTGNPAPHGRLRGAAASSNSPQRPQSRSQQQRVQQPRPQTVQAVQHSQRQQPLRERARLLSRQQPAATPLRLPRIEAKQGNTTQRHRPRSAQIAARVETKQMQSQSQSQSQPQH